MMNSSLKINKHYIQKYLFCSTDTKDDRRPGGGGQASATSLDFWDKSKVKKEGNIYNNYNQKIEISAKQLNVFSHVNKF
jgi:hypothetical protein